MLVNIPLNSEFNSIFHSSSRYVKQEPRSYKNEKFGNLGNEGPKGITLNFTQISLGGFVKLSIFNFFRKKLSQKSDL